MAPYHQHQPIGTVYNGERIRSTIPDYFGRIPDTDRSAAVTDYYDPFPLSFAPKTDNANTLSSETDDGNLLNGLQEFDRFNGTDPVATMPTNVPDHLHGANTVEMILNSIPLRESPQRDDFAGLLNLRNSSQMHNSASIGPDGAELAHASSASGPSASSARVSKKPTRKGFVRWGEEELRVTLELRARHTKQNGHLDHVSLYKEYCQHFPKGRNLIAVKEKIRKYDKVIRTKALLAKKATDTKGSLLKNGTEKVDKAAGIKSPSPKNGTGESDKAAGTKGPLPTKGTREYHKAPTSFAEEEADELGL